MRFIKIKTLGIINDHLVDYPTPLVGYSGSFGFLTGVCLVIQIITGTFLAIYYIPNAELAFYSVEYIIREVNDGWLFRYIHSVGASIFFICLYLHIYINFQSDADNLVWYSGVILYALSIFAAFVGYTLPWGQISYWGTIVITNSLASIPYIGPYIVSLLWGGFSISNPTLSRFFAFHVVLPFVILGFVIIHLSLVHVDESSSTDDEEYASFFEFYFYRDMFVFFSFLTVYSYIVFFIPNLFSNPYNYIRASITVTPNRLVPEWYFWPFYAVLRSIPDKFGGFCIIVLLFVDIFILETNHDEDDSEIFWELVNGTEYNANAPQAFSIEKEIDVGIFVVIGYLGQFGLEEPYPDIISGLSLINFFGKCRFSFEVDEFE